jgi:hypothetical protein
MSSSARMFFAGALTTAIAISISMALLVTEVMPGWRMRHFDEITVSRINVVDGDGTKRIVIAGMSRFPGDFVKGVETRRPDRSNVAGMIFLNDEGTENGGLIYRGRIGGTGGANAAMSLTFDRFRQDQVLQLAHDDEEGQVSTAIKINDAPDFRFSSITDVRLYSTAAKSMPPRQRAAYFDKLKGDGKLLRSRVFLGTTSDHASTLVLKDANGRARMTLSVGADGTPRIQLIDEQGSVVKTIDENSK